MRCSCGAAGARSRTVSRRRCGIREQPELVAADPVSDQHVRRAQDIGPVRIERRAVADHARDDVAARRVALHDRGGQHDRCEHEAGDIGELPGDEAPAEPWLQHPVVEQEQRDRRERHRVQGFADGQPTIRPAQRSPQSSHSYMVPIVSESDKPSEKPPSESAQQLAAAEAQAKERFEKAMTELREAAYRFSSRARGQSELIIEELIDPEGDTVPHLAEVEGDVGAQALAQSLELITFDTWLFGQIGDKDALDLKAEDHWEVWFTFGAWIGETMRRRHGGHWLLMGDDPHTWRIGFSKIFLEIAPFVFAEMLLRTGSGATKKMVTEIERIRQLHEPD